MLEFNPRYDDLNTVKAIRAKAMANLVAGITITSFVSEGSQFIGKQSADTKDILIATERYLDQYYGELVTQTAPNFFTIN